MTRRALLAGAIGGLGALAANVIGGASKAEASAGSPLIIGSSTNNAGSSNTILTTNSSVVAFELIQQGGGTAVMGYATPSSGPTRGVYGRSDSPYGYGVQARNAGAPGPGAAVQAIGGNNVGVLGSSTSGFGIYGYSSDKAGVAGASGTSVGVQGFSASNAGIHGNSNGGTGVLGTSATGYAGKFDGSVKVEQNLDIGEFGTPVHPGPNVARLFVRDNGAGKTQLCVLFPTGVVEVLSAEA
jgi:hypothetical protein